MSEFFRGWKRKIGCITLLLACVVMVGWLRSTSWVDSLEVRINLLTVVSLRSSTDGIEWTRFYHSVADELEARGFTDSIRLTSWKRPEVRFPDSEGFGFVWYLNNCGFRIGKGYGDYLPEQLTVCIAPHFAIVIPLTALSAYLLLSKSRTSTLKKINEPTSNERT